MYKLTKVLFTPISLTPMKYLFYSRTNGQAYVWDELIFPGMSESIYAVLKATTDTPYYRNRTFQLFGADFVITDNYVPYLIEINSIPGLNPSTSVIANLASMLLEDIIKGKQKQCIH